MKKIVLMAVCLVSGLSMISCTAEAIDDTASTTVVADGEPVVTPVVIPPPKPPKP